MITQSFLNREIDLAKRIFIYYTDKLLDVISIAGKDNSPWYYDSMQIDYFLNALKSITLVDGAVFIGATEVGEAYLATVGANIREFLNYELRQIVYLELNAEDVITGIITPSEPPIVISYPTAVWKHWPIAITSEAPATVALPFDISTADSNSLTVKINDQDPDHLVEPTEEGCHIIGAVLYWHNYYDLHLGDTLYISYQEL